MVNICDLALVGTKLEHGGHVIDLTKEYFQQEVIERDYAGELLKKCVIANLVGNAIVGQALEMGMAKEVSVRRISGVPFLMIFKFEQM
jgi:uncharacterized protein